MSAPVTTILKCLNESGNYNIIDMPMRAKKRRLDHLSWEEKVQRKKLKNRVAAQTSRDRKKAKMDDMELALQELFTKNTALIEQCQSHQQLNERLRQENAQLKESLASPCANCAQSRSVECETKTGSAASPLPQQGLATHSAASLSPQTQALLKILLACFLYRTSSTSSTATSTCLRSSSSPKASCRISPETWKLLLKKQIYKNQAVLKKWWGRHQNNWNPLEMAA